ncbi:regulatory protein [Desulfosporosinus sp. Tol-M]|nr:regulatory protein [Desulfosporosinus sp. Tol-M]
MPSYDMVCQECGHKFFVFCTISQKDQKVCPECESPKVSQRFTTVNIIGSRNSGGVSGGVSSEPAKSCGFN